MTGENKYKTKKAVIEELDKIFELYKNYLNDSLGATETSDYKNILLISTLNRSVSLMEAYKKLLYSNNIMVLNSLNRIQLDNCIFVHGICLLVKDGHNIDELGSSIIQKNKKLSSYKIGNQNLRDSYLISEIDKNYKMDIKKMYDFYCRFIHFSDSALHTSSQVLDNVLLISCTNDYSRFKKNIIPNANTFIKLCKFLLSLINDEWKDIPNGKKKNI